jgi:hypothetical protein
MQSASLDLLEKTHLPPDQVRAILQAMELEITARQEASASKTELKDAFHALELRIQGSESRLTRWVFTCMLGQTVVIIGALYFALTHLRS